MKKLFKLFSIILCICISLSLASCGKSYDISGIKFEDAEFTYNTKPHSIEIEGDLPEGVTVEYQNNNQINAGTYEVIAKLYGDGKDDAVEDMIATLTIKKEMAYIKCDNIVAEYGEEIKTLTYKAEGFFSSDLANLTVDLETNAKPEIGTYTINASNCNLTDNYDIIYKSGTYTVDKKTYTITFNQFGYTTTAKVKEGESLTNIPNPSKIKGYTVSWDRSDFTNITENIVVNAIKTPNKYKITLHNNLENAETIETEATYDQLINLPSFTLNNYFLTNWTNKEGEIFFDEFIYKIDNDIDLYAEWSTDLTAELNNEFHTALVSNSTDSNVTIPKYYYSKNSETGIYEKYQVIGFTDNAFKNNNYISSLDFESDCNIEIMENVFYGCSGLQTITLPESLIALTGNSFYNCNLNKITINSKCLYSFGNGSKYHSIFGGNNIQNVILIIGNTCEYIPDYFTINMKDELKEIRFEDKSKLKEIGCYAFNGLSLNDALGLPESLEIIKEGAFANINSYVYINSCNNLHTIEAQAFFGANITTLLLPDSVKYIGEKVFYLSNLDTLAIKAASNLEEIGKWAFFGTDIGDITLPSTIKIIGEEAFKACRINITVPFASNNVPSGFNQYWIDETYNTIIYQES